MVMAIAGGCIVSVFLFVAAVSYGLRKRGERLYEKYRSFTVDALDSRFTLNNHQVKEEFRILSSWKYLKLFKIVNRSYAAERIGRISIQNATMMFFMKMYRDSISKCPSRE